jgi:hypothetical protein
LRVASLLLALAVMLKPSLVFTERRKQSASLILLYDRSRSMLVADAWNSQPRWRAMNQSLAQAESSLKKLQDVLEIRQHQFDSKIAAATNLNEPPSGNQTGLGDVLREARQAAPGRVAVIVLFSDGVNTIGTPPTSEAQNLRDLGVPLYTVGFGQATDVTASRDMAMRTITAGPTVFEKNKLVVTGELRARGFAGQKVNVRLLFDGAPADTQTIDLSPTDDQTDQRVELSHIPTTPGEHKVTLAVSELEPKKGELVESNNEVSTFVTVLKGGLRVQFLDGGFGSWEPTFVRLSLDKSPDIKVDFVSVRRKEDLADAADPASALFDRTRYDVFLMRDVPRSWFPDAALERLKKAVDSGSGLAMLGGRQSFGPGGYAGTPLADVLPVDIHPGDGQVDRALAMRPTAQGIGHFLLRLGPEADPTGAWESLRPLDGATAFSEVKDQARVLAESPDHVPLVVAQDYGQGRSMALAADSTWLWHTQSEEGLRHHRRFWRQVILWLAKKDQAGESRVWVKLDKRRVAAGDQLEVTAGADDEQGNPLRDAEIEVTVTPPPAPGALAGSPVPLRVSRQGDAVRGTFWNTDKAGDYQVSVTARHQGKELGPPRQAKFLVHEDDTELLAPAADIALLTRMAELTGGKYVQPEQLASFFDDLARQDLHLETERLTQLRLWDRWEFFLLFVALLAAEWALRKWKGLV